MAILIIMMQVTHCKQISKPGISAWFFGNCCVEYSRRSVSPRWCVVVYKKTLVQRTDIITEWRLQVDLSAKTINRLLKMGHICVWPSPANDSIRVSRLNAIFMYTKSRPGITGRFRMAESVEKEVHLWSQLWRSCGRADWVVHHKHSHCHRYPKGGSDCLHKTLA